MAELVLRLRVAGNQDIQQALQSLGASAQVVSQKVTQATRSSEAGFTTTRQSLRDFGQALSGVAAVASIFAKSNPELQRSLEVISLTSSALGTTLRAVASSMKVVIGVIGIKIAIIAGLVVGIIALVRHWDEAKAAISRAVQAIGRVISDVFAGVRNVFQGFVQILVGALRGNMDQVRAGIAQMQEGFSQIKTVVIDVTHAAIDLGKRGLEFLKQQFAQVKDATDNADNAIVDFHTNLRKFFEVQAKARQEAFIRETDALIAEERRLAEETVALTDLANQQVIQAIEEEERARMEAGQRMLADAQRIAEERIATERSAWQQVIGQTMQGGNLLVAIWDQIMGQIIEKIAAAIAQAQILRGLGGFFGGILGGVLGLFGIRIPGLQHGGIVTRPTLAMVGEAGPEAVIPLSRGPQMVPAMAGNTYNLNVSFEGVLGVDDIAATRAGLKIMEVIRRQSGRR